MSETVKLIVEIPKETKQEFDKTESIALKGAYFDLDGIIGKAIQNGTPFDSNSEKAEVQAYFAGQTYGWEEGRKALIEDIKAEIKQMEYHMIDCDVLVDQEEVLDIIENYKREEKG